MTLTLATAETCQTRFGFDLANLIADGWLPANIGVELGSDAIRKHYHNVRNRGYHNVDNWLLTILEEATAIEKTATTTAAETAELTKEEIEAANAVIEYASCDALNAQVIRYIVNNQPVGSHHFCKMIGVHTATMAARVHHIKEAAKPENGQSLRDRLIRILKVKLVSYGGQNKAI